MNTKLYALYDLDADGYWYNDGGEGNANWTMNSEYAQTKPTLGEIFYICAQLYEVELMMFSTILVVEFVEDIADFKNPIWVGDQGLFRLWGEIKTKEEKHKVIKSLANTGLMKMYKISLGWYNRGV